MVTGAEDASPDAASASPPLGRPNPGADAEALSRPAFAAAVPAAARPAAVRPSTVQRTASPGADNPGELMQFGSNTSLVLRRVATPGVTGGLLQANPHLEKRQRRQLGLALRF
jgi:hypothetical protein